jgi:hypothetical protein
MTNVIPLRPNKHSIRRLAAREVERLNELYRISAGGSDSVPDTDPEIEEMVRLGVIETPWRNWWD